MTFQWGKKIECAFSIYWNITVWNGDIAFPLSLSWWREDAIQENEGWAFDVSLHILCFGFSLEIWNWEKNQ